MKEPVDHVLRPHLPWRRNSESEITECGYDSTKVKAITREEFFQRLKGLGQQRTAMLTCMTCSDTARRHEAWDEDPRRALEREVLWECRGRWSNDDRGSRLKDELQAIAALIEAHRDEFDALANEIKRRREWNDMKQRGGHRR